MKSTRPYLSLLDQLASGFRARLSIIADYKLRDQDPVAHLKKLMEASQTLDALIAALPKSELDPHLRHYLDRCSFDKALEWIESNRVG